MKILSNEFSGDRSQPQNGRGLGDLYNYVRSVFRRRYITFLAVTISTLLLFAGIIVVMAPKYEAQALIRIDPSRSPSASQNPGQFNLNPEAIETEISVLSSLELAREVVRRLRLQDDAEFNQKLDLVSGSDEAARINIVASRVMRNFSVNREKLSYVLAVKFRSKNPDKAARIANMFAQTYLDIRVSSRMNSAERQASWFKQRLGDLGNQVQAADQRVAQYRGQTGIVQGSNGTIADQQIAPLSAQLAAAEAAAATARSNLAAARSQIASGGLDAVSEVRNSEVITDYRRKRAEILQGLSDATSRNGERHPETIRARQQLAAIDLQISQEATRAVGTLEAQASAADAQVGSLRSAMRSLEGRQVANTRDAVIADSLERDAANKRTAYDRLSQMSLDSIQTARNSIGQAEIVDPALRPTAPVPPSRSLLAAVGVVIAFALGFSFIAAQELLAPGLRTVDQIQRLLRVPLLAAIPRIPHNRGRKSKGTQSDTLVRQPASLFGEALRNLRASVVGVRQKNAQLVIAITSALPQEGKTTTSLSFARMLAMNGARTLLIDCDVRKASIRQLVRSDHPIGLIEVLAGSARVEEAIVTDRIEKLDLLMVTEPYFSVEDLFGDGTISTLIEQLQKTYENIVLDLPPLIGLADGRFLSVLADKVILAVRWGATPQAAVSAAMALLREDGAKVAGAVFTMVDPNAEAIGGQYYSRRYDGYYQKLITKADL